MSKICTASAPASRCAIRYRATTRASFANSAPSRSGRENASRRSVGNPGACFPSTRYAASDHGAPPKPSGVARPASSRFTIRSAAATSGAISPASGSGRRRIDASSFAGASQTGPGAKRNGWPSAASGLTRSAKTIAASKPNRAIGCSVTSAASSGVAHSSSNERSARSARYSGR